MKFRIEPKIFQQFADLGIGVVSARGIDNHGEPGDIKSLLRTAEERLVASFQGILVTEHPRIAPWREAYRRFGAKPKKYPSSIENLVRRTLKGNRLRHINMLVDIYNVVSLRHLLPAGGEDLDRIRGDILLTFAEDDEAPVQMLGETEERPPHAGEVIYKDEVGTICRRWNWKEADRTKLTEDTVNAVLVIEALAPVSSQELEAAITDLAGLIERFCGGEARPAFLDKDHRETNI
jgi:DNA/RNA-binding domain of Phe-tRNA-synthetase-like protein